MPDRLDDCIVLSLSNQPVAHTALGILDIGVTQTQRKCEPRPVVLVADVKLTFRRSAVAFADLIAITGPEGGAVGLYDLSTVIDCQPTGRFFDDYTKATLRLMKRVTGMAFQRSGIETDVLLNYSSRHNEHGCDEKHYKQSSLPARHLLIPFNRWVLRKHHYCT